MDSMLRFQVNKDDWRGRLWLIVYHAFALFDILVYVVSLTMLCSYWRAWFVFYDEFYDWANTNNQQPGRTPTEVTTK